MTQKAKPGYRTKQGSKWDAPGVVVEAPKLPKVVAVKRDKNRSLDDRAILSVYEEDLDGIVARR